MDQPPSHSAVGSGAETSHVSSIITIAVPPPPTSTPSRVLSSCEYTKYMAKVNSLKKQLSSTGGLVCSFSLGYGPDEPYFNCRTGRAVRGNIVSKEIDSQGERGPYRSSMEQHAFILESLVCIRASFELLLPQSDKDNIFALWDAMENYERKNVYKTKISPYTSAAVEEIGRIEESIVSLGTMLENALRRGQRG